MIMRCLLCNKRVWPWQAHTPSIDHRDCVIQEMWLKEASRTILKEERTVPCCCQDFGACVMCPTHGTSPLMHSGAAVREVADVRLP